MSAFRELMDEILDGPVVGGMLDDDFYTLTMGQVAVLCHPTVEADFQLTNRTTDIPLAVEVSPDELGVELDRLKARSFTRTEIHYVLGTDEYGLRMFRPEFIDHLRQLSLPDYTLRVTDDLQYDLSFVGNWAAGMHCEVPTLAAINGLRSRNAMRKLSPFERDHVLATGIQRLREKIVRIRQYPSLTFCDFGTRRRFHRAWQRYIDKTLAEELPGQFLGTSNIEAAKDFGLLPMGTNAHQMYMVIAAILSATDEGLKNSHNQVLQEWWKIYGWGLSIALTDTFGTDFFFRDFTPEQAREWKGLRQDSGDPFEFGRKAIAFYRKYGINPIDKLLIFSDGLDMDLIIELWVEFEKMIRVTFGWGTHLTNDLGLSTLSLVIKAMRARLGPDGQWFDTCKLTDNIQKAMGRPEVVDRYQRAFDYHGTFSQTCEV